MNDLFDTSKKPIPLFKLNRPKPERIIAPNGRDLRGRPIHYDTTVYDDGSRTDVRVKYKPEGKPLHEAFEVTNVVWERTIQHISQNKHLNGQIQTAVFFSGTGEREYAERNKGTFIFL